ncbi:MAG TPA: isoprenylcysteine carboxylmethyltransferase family protein, partial [Candidatus Melainabacteria bacterium]|nr:isoprenylcysteine carboxylmethyltransferase family protein [Candidatus Melainabacteria bacterium]
PFFWVIFITNMVLGIAGIFILPPELLAERFKPKGKDLDPFGPVIISFLFMSINVLAALDCGRWHISDFSNPAAQILGCIAHAVGWIGFTWSMWTNKFFSSAIRLQPDRRQSVVAAGPYKFVRHPGYSFASIAVLGQCIGMGSWLCFIPGLLVVFDLMYRTLLEERMLRTGLEGYDEYTKKTKHRWVPGVW